MCKDRHNVDYYQFWMVTLKHTKPVIFLHNKFRSWYLFHLMEFTCIRRYFKTNMIRNVFQKLVGWNSTLMAGEKTPSEINLFIIITLVSISVNPIFKLDKCSCIICHSNTTRRSMKLNPPIFTFSLFETVKRELHQKQDVRYIIKTFKSMHLK